MRVVMMGAGYVGLVSGACFAEFGAHVTCVDVDADKVARLARGEIPIYEPGLDELAARNADVGRLSFTTDLASAVPQADLVFIAVGTPSRRGDASALDRLQSPATPKPRTLGSRNGQEEAGDS